MTIKLDNEVAIRCIAHVVHNKMKFGYTTGDAMQDVLSIISEQGADYILQEILERLS